MTLDEAVALLREARMFVALSGYGKAPLARIDAALAEHDAEEKAEVRWMQNGFVEEEQIADVRGGTIVVRARAPDDWAWRLIRQGRCSTENEAKSAAISAARGMK